MKHTMSMYQTKDAMIEAMQAEIDLLEAQLEEARSAAIVASRAGQVLTVQREPDYWSRGHFYEGYRSWIDPNQVRNLPIGTKLLPLPHSDF